MKFRPIPPYIKKMFLGVTTEALAECWDQPRLLGMTFLCTLSEQEIRDVIKYLDAIERASWSRTDYCAFWNKSSPNIIVKSDQVPRAVLKAVRELAPELLGMMRGELPIPKNVKDHL